MRPTIYDIVSWPRAVILEARSMQAHTKLLRIYGWAIDFSC